MAWFPRNFIQSEVSIYATCSNLHLLRDRFEQVWMWVVKRATSLLQQCCKTSYTFLLPVLLCLSLEQQQKIFLNIHFEFTYFSLFLTHLELKRKIRSYTPVVTSKTIPDSRPKWAKYIPVFRPKRRKSPTRLGGTYIYGLYKGVPPRALNRHQPPSNIRMSTLKCWEIWVWRAQPHLPSTSITSASSLKEVTHRFGGRRTNCYEIGPGLVQIMKWQPVH